MPSSQTSLPQLEVLRVSKNRIKSLPEGLSSSSLRLLDLTGNLLTRLPDDLGQLPKLVELLVGSNDLLTLPSSLARLTALRRLHLNSNNLTTNALENVDWSGGYLQHLWLQHNKIRRLPETILANESLRPNVQCDPGLLP